MFLKSDETYNVSVFLWNTVITCFIDITNLKYNLFRDIPFVLRTFTFVILKSIACRKLKAIARTLTV